jgi:CBS domain containing-hemolysin-like protein
VPAVAHGSGTIRRASAAANMNASASRRAISACTASAPPIADAGDGAVIVAGTVRLDELGQHFNRTLEHEEVDSVSGLILMALGRPPAVGDAIDYEGVHFEVTSTSGRGVKEARASVPPSGHPAS